MSIEQKIAELLAESKKTQLAEEAADVSDELDEAKKKKGEVCEEVDEELAEEAANGKTDGVTSVAGDNPDNKKNAVTDEKQAEGGTSKTANKVTAGASAPEGTNLKSVKEDVDALFNGEEGFTEEFRQKAETIFEAAVMTRVKDELARIEEEYQTQLAEQVDQVKEGLVEKVDGYLDYIVEQWMEQNEIALESGMKSDILESFVGGLKGLFEEHYIDVPEEKYDVLGEMEQHIATLEEKLNETTGKNVELNKTLDEMARQKTIEEAATGLTDTEVEKFKGLAEELSYENQETFKTKLQTIRENYFGDKKNTSSVVSSVVSDEAVTLTEDKVVDSSIKSYLQVLNSIKK
jgi:hypothetical protein